ncbi:MAG: hypothetical protein FJ285_07815 [Planctomycetes bacterium]|nr:hypothetical protein [Planctomycetota bacterium]
MRCRSFGESPWMVIAAVLCLGACSDIRTTQIKTVDVPDDAAIDVTILTGQGVKDLPQAHLRQGKFTMLSDGSLHSDYGDSLTFLTRPAITRWLYRDQVNGVWSLACETGWISPSQSTVDEWPSSVVPAPDEIVYILFFHAEGTDWWFVRRFKATEVPDANAVTLVRSLCSLAWATDRSADRNLPQRYDFGPDPYAGFDKAPPYQPIPRQVQ